MSKDTIEAAFWILVGVSFLGFFGVLEYGIQSGPSGGAVGAWLLVLPLLFLVGVGVVFQATSNPELRMVCLGAAGIVFLGVAGVSFQLLVVEPINERAMDKRRALAESGVGIFPDAAQVEFLKAVREHDAAKAKALLPMAGDLNKQYGATTLFLFALEHGGTEPGEADLQIVEAMLKAGANPNVPAGRALALVRFRGPGIVKLLLEAGADVNVEGAGGDPLWWSWFGGSGNADCVKLAIAHGADLQGRKDGVGVVAMAASSLRWEAVVLLMEAGAPYKWEGAKREGMLLHDFVIAERQSSRRNGENNAALERAAEIFVAARN